MSNHILSKPHYLRFAALALVLSAFIFLVLPYGLRLFDPTAGAFDAGTINALALAAVLFVAVLHLAFFAYRQLFPRFYDYQRECLEGEGKLFEKLTENLEKPLYPTGPPMELSVSDAMLLAAERRKVAQFKFTIRCVRLFFCLLCLGFLLWLALHMLTVAMTAVPGSAPSI
ncbi:hypothetical protein [uncultured Hymenobacter sp.]|uniref:hypothetical protein n=1 Tax=uncultured Hymenobacter sp. TaxID=170016 RepID=UPI0035CB4B27